MAGESAFLDDALAQLPSRKEFNTLLSDVMLDEAGNRKIPPRNTDATTLIAENSGFELNVNDLPEWPELTNYRNALHYLVEAKKSVPRKEWEERLAKEARLVKLAAEALAFRLFIHTGENLSPFGRDGVPLAA
jgi:hypothetical protein